VDTTRRRIGLVAWIWQKLKSLGMNKLKYVLFCLYLGVVYFAKICLRKGHHIAEDEAGEIPEGGGCTGKLCND
jgi:hypothetical protein